MFKSTLIHSLLVSLLAIALFSCENDASITEGTTLSDDIKPVLNFPERIPADAYLNTLMMSNQTDWKVYDKYYRNEVLSQSEKVFFKNLQWSTVSHMVRNTDFLQSSGSKDQDYYLNEILDRSYINKPDAILAILKKRQLMGRTVKK